MQTALAEDLHACWFGPALETAADARTRVKLWFSHDPEFDSLLAERFGDLPQRVLEGEFDRWAHAPRYALARILALDQLPRNIFRNRALAYAFDACALSAAAAAVAAGHDRELQPLEAVFVYLPYEHAEDLNMQIRAIGLFEALRSRAAEDLQQLFAGFVDSAHRHHEVVRRFGRFPHRNDVLGRTSTPEEQAYLSEGGERFGSRRGKRKVTSPPAPGRASG